jgi:hypothetical protein
MKALRGIAALALLALVSGCQQPPKEGEKISPLKLGTVDVMRVMEEKPETVQIKLDWATQAGQTYTKLANAKDRAAYDALQKQIEEQSVAWQKRMDTFMEQSIAEVEVEAEKLARERGLDMIVVDNTLTKTLKYNSGEDLTTDILIRLQTSGK